MKSEVFTLIDILGTTAFSVSGVFAAMEKKLDIFGIFIIAFITAIGGGTIRDVIIGDFPVAWMRSNNYSIVIFLSASIAILFYKRIKDYGRILLLFDSIGIGFFTVLGIHKGIDFDFSPGLCVALGTITACFGGLIRDITLNQIPHIFHKEIYATACIFGGTLYFALLKMSLPGSVLDAICISIIVLVRLIAVKYNWSLPVIYRSDKKE
ncbi:MAG TPA: trimeric intracellular cation channel family protein [Flavitalea sp.]|nr:trimeric intracellular cation channel family protein [Flavitalea sp.]